MWALLGSYRRNPLLVFSPLEPFIPRAVLVVLCNLRRLWVLAAIKWSTVFSRVGPFSNAIRHKHSPRRYLWSHTPTDSSHQGGLQFLMQAHVWWREWGDNDCRPARETVGMAGGRHISVLIMCHSQGWEMLRKQSGELCGAVISVVSVVLQCVTGRDIQIAARERKTVVGAIGKANMFISGWLPPHGIHSYVCTKWFILISWIHQVRCRRSLWLEDRLRLWLSKKMIPRKEGLRSCW